MFLVFRKRNLRETVEDIQSRSAYGTRTEARKVTNVGRRASAGFMCVLVEVGNEEGKADSFSLVSLFGRRQLRSRLDAVTFEAKYGQMLCRGF